MIKLITHRILIGGTLLALAAMPALGREDGNNDPGDRYEARELTLDVFGTAALGEYSINHISNTRVRQDTRLGVGLGVGYFFTRNIGVGLEGYSENTQGMFVDNASVNLTLRFPLGHSGLAPYIMGGVGHQFETTEKWFGQVGAGLEYRFTSKMGLFTDARWVQPDKEKYYGVARVGLRFAF